MAGKILFIGIMTGLAAAMGLAGLFSAISTHSAAQMMGGNHMGMMGHNMMTTGGTQVLPHQLPWHLTSKASCGSNGISYVENVRITGISINSDKLLTVNLKYIGNGAAPNVVIVALEGSVGMMGGHMPMMGCTIYGGQMAMWDEIQLQQWHRQMAQWHSQMSNQTWNNMMMNPNMMGMGWNQQSLLTGSTAIVSG